MKSILCIDDDQDILDTFNVILSTEGYQVVTSSSPSQVFELIGQHNPALILLDINMDEFNGLELCKAIRSNLSTKDTPVVMVSSDPSIDSAISEYGATDILLKPFTVKELVDTADYYLAAKIISIFPDNSEIKEIN